MKRETSVRPHHFGHRKMPRRLFIWGSIAIAAICVVAAVASWAYIEEQPNPPDGVRCYTMTERVPVSPLDRWEKPGFQVTQFAKLRSGEVVAPILRVVRPNYRGFMGGVRHDPIWEGAFRYLGERQAWFEIPIDDEIEHYIVFVRRLATHEKPGDTAWRTWVFVSDDTGRKLIMPSFDRMEPLSSRKDASALLEKHKIAKTYAMELRK